MHCERIVVTDRTQIAGRQRHQSLRPTGCHHKLNLVIGPSEPMHNRPDIPSAQTKAREIAKQHNRVESSEFGHQRTSTGYAVTNRGSRSPIGTIQTDANSRDRPEGPSSIPSTTHFCPWRVGVAGTARPDFA
jgi:hypothetical protein